VICEKNVRSRLLPVELEESLSANEPEASLQRIPAAGGVAP
jgi:hypothetical protein